MPQAVLRRTKSSPIFWAQGDAFEHPRPRPSGVEVSVELHLQVFRPHAENLQGSFAPRARLQRQGIHYHSIEIERKSPDLTRDSHEPAAPRPSGQPLPCIRTVFSHEPD